MAPTIVHIKVPDLVASPVAAPSPTLAEPASTPLTAAALQRHEALMQQPGDSSSDAMALAGVPASLSLGMSMHQGAIFGVVSTVAVEAMQLSLAQKRGSAAAQTANLASAAARGAAVGAAGGGMALLLGPVAPTAIFVGYGLIREWSAQGYAWLQNQTTGHGCCHTSERLQRCSYSRCSRMQWFCRQLGWPRSGCCLLPTSFH